MVHQLKAERGVETAASKALTVEQNRIQELEARVNRLEREKVISKKGYCSIDVGRVESHALIDRL